MPIDLNEAKFRYSVAQSLILQRQRTGHADVLHVPGSNIILYGYLVVHRKAMISRKFVGRLANYGISVSRSNIFDGR
jgi:hypothetical protein